MAPPSPFRAMVVTVVWELEIAADTRAVTPPRASLATWSENSTSLPSKVPPVAVSKKKATVKASAKGTRKVSLACTMGVVKVSTSRAWT